MSYLASFYLLKNGKRQELFDGNCSGVVYMAIWDWCEGKLGIDGRFHAPQTEDVLDCLLFDEEMAAGLLTALGKQNLLKMAEEIASDWDLSMDAVQKGLETLCSYLEKMNNGDALLYEMI